MLFCLRTDDVTFVFVFCVQMQGGPDMKKSQQSWEKLKKSHTIQSHLDDEHKQPDDEDEMSLLSGITMDTQHSLKLQRLNDDIQRLLEEKKLNQMGIFLTKKRVQKKKGAEAMGVDGTSVRSEVTLATAHDDGRELESAGDEGSSSRPRQTGADAVAADQEEELRSFDSEESRDRHRRDAGGERRDSEFFDSDYDSGTESDDNNSTYTADQSMARDLPPLHMKEKGKQRHEDEDYDEEEDHDDDPLYLPTYASEFGTPRPWSQLPEEEKRKIAMRTERRNRGLDLYAVKHNAGANSSRASGRSDLLVSTNRSDISDYEESWDRANEKVMEAMARAQVSPTNALLGRGGDLSYDGEDIMLSRETKEVAADG
jgi:hypothetical protein